MFSARSIILVLLSGCAGGGAHPRGPSATIHLLTIDTAHNKAVTQALSQRPELEVKAEDPLELLKAKTAAEGADPRGSSATGDPGEDLRAELAAALELARQAYRELRFADALAEIDRRQAAILPRLRTREEVLLLAELHLNAGLNHLALKRRERAERAFTTAFLLGHPGPEAGQYSPEVEATISETRAALERATEGELLINLTPGSAEVTLDGERLEGSPARAKTRPGLHLVRVEAQGHLPQVFFQRVSAGKLERIELALQPAGKPTLAAELLRKHPDGKGLSGEDPGQLGRTLGWRRALLEVGDAASSLEGVMLWTGEEGGGSKRERCEGKSHRGLSDCLGPLLYQLSTGATLQPAPEERPSVFRRWWFWTAVGAAVAGGAATAIYFGTRDTSGTDIDLQFAR